jgi:hypothetical protein
VRFSRERSREQLYENVRTRRENDLLSLTLRSLPTPGWTVEQTLEGDRDEIFTELLDEAARQGSQGWRSARAKAGAWWRANPLVTVRLSGSTRWRERIGGDLTLRVLELLPGVAVNAGRRARVDLSATRTWLDRARPEVLGLERSGWEGRASGSVRLHGSLDGSVNFEVRAPDQGASITTARAELRALF